MTPSLQGSFTRYALLVGLLAGGAPLWPRLVAEPEAAQEAKASAPPLVEAFRKGPISMFATVVRPHAGGGDTSLPLFQVPVLQFQDRLELAFAGEAFDRRVTSADWSVVVVFLPKTIAPTEQGVVAFPLKRKGDRVVVPPILAPYDAIPMIFLVPDRGGRKKILADLSAHLEAFRTLCAKIADLSEERAEADKFLRDLDAIDKNLSPVAYDNAVMGFLHVYGNQVSADLQGFLNHGTNNLDKFQFLASQFRKTNVLVPEAAAASPVEAQVSVSAGGGKAVSAYVSIFFDLAAIVRNLWPGHQYQYLPALARNFGAFSAELYYSDWVRTTGEVRGAILCCPGQWEAQAPPAFDLDLPAGESLLNKQTLLKVRLKDKGKGPFTLYGQGWKLLVTGPQGEALPPLHLTPSPGQQGFVAATSALQEPLRKLGPGNVKARVVGNWGFTSLATAPLDIPLGCDPAWAPTAEEAAAFQVGKACTLTLPRAWARSVAKVVFRPGGTPALTALLKDGADGARLAEFKPGPGDSGPGHLDLYVLGVEQPALTLPLSLLASPPELTAVEVRQGDATILVRGRRLEGIQAMELGARRFLPVPAGEPACIAFKAEDGKLFEGSRGTLFTARLLLKDGRQQTFGTVPLLAPRPRLGEIRIATAENRAGSLPLVTSASIAPTGFPSQVSIVTDKGYRFPADRTFQVAFRNAEEPGELRLVSGSRVRVTGNNQKALVTLHPQELLGGRASGQLELQVQDQHGGASDWCAIPATFVDLPTLRALRPVGGVLQLSGPSLDQIEAVAAAPGGPWEKLTVQLEGGQEVANLPAPSKEGLYWLRLFGWPELALTLKAPAPAVLVPAAAPQAATPHEGSGTIASAPPVSAPAASAPGAPAPGEEGGAKDKSGS